MKQISLLAGSLAVASLLVGCGGGSSSSSSSDTNSAPTITTTTFSTSENSTYIGNIDAQDADGDTLSYTLSGVDADLFSIDTNGDISFNSAPDYENPTDEGNDNSYTFEVSVNDGITSSEETVTVTVTDVTEDTNTAPVVGDAVLSLYENTTSAGSVNASDGEGDALTYYLSGEDASLVESDANGNISFLTAPDYENPSDNDADNLYAFDLTVSDGELNTTQTIVITVEDVLDAGTTVYDDNNLPYTVIVSPYTAKMWLDKNLGATRVCTSYNDSACYGDYFQWGRDSDGHEDSASSTTSTLSTTDTPGHSNFISVFTDTNDWRSPKNDSLWQGSDGINNPCPTGFKVPTQEELRLETLAQSNSTLTTVYESFLKIPMNGYRDYLSTTVNYTEERGYLWTSTVSSTDASGLVISASSGSFNADYRMYGKAVRCIGE